jgi:hypothetical protein
MGAIAHCRNFKYLGCVLSETAKDEVIVKDRISKAWKVFFANKHTLLHPNLSLTLRYRLVQIFVHSSVLFGCEALTLKRSTMEKVNRFEKHLLRKVCGVKAKDEVPTETLRQKVKAGELTLAQQMRLRRLRFIGHTMRHETSILSNLLRSCAPNQALGRHKCYLKEIVEELDQLRAHGYEASITHHEMCQERNAFRKTTWDFAESSVLGKLLCPECGADYIYPKSLRTHILRLHPQTNAPVEYALAVSSSESGRAALLWYAGILLIIILMLLDTNLI